jgi:hypothetical protein
LLGLILFVVLRFLRLLCLGLLRCGGLCLRALFLLLGLFVWAVVVRTAVFAALARACLGRFIVLLIVFHKLPLLC